MPRVKRNHNSSRSLVCLICRFKIFKNGSILKDNSKLTSIIRANYELFNDYDPNDMTFPNGVCSTCTRALNKSHNSKNKDILPTLKLCAYNAASTAVTHTRSCSNASPCDICLIAGQQYKPSSRENCKCSLCQPITINQPIA